jgi:broad specificity phosphatase PhoE
VLALAALGILVAARARSAPAGDPGMPAGKERARALVEALKDSKVTAIITSDAQRTRDTAQPLAEALGLTPKVVALGRSGPKAHAEAVAAELRRLAGGVVVVVDHSDTLPLIIAALGGPHIPEIASKEYANFFLLTPGPSGARLVRARYGAPDGGP